MTLADVNVLIGAFRPDTPNHPTCRAWLDGVLRGDARFGVSTLALAALVRITTNGRAFAQPSPGEEAFGFCQDLLGQPHCETVEPGPRHWPIFERLCLATGIRGPQTTDVWYTALAIESGCEWITLDRDFARFPGLRWVHLA